MKKNALAYFATLSLVDKNVLSAESHWMLSKNGFF
jgi:hypothetical protein